ncbi:hypothetical protein POJ06DRAFT_200648 [Lipomyces tetrasporus]|uniref:Vacuolar protein sorting-associated protein 41 n=1 Tax=Lipomyces tetrasporus TaxID=54092 RepID=A0AAD7QR05_9ASCO|nr:uncharacterized protein POJ06DRAFT_200648 [Lipomyces tetrasporus]KAJ8098222.1 hypothetical protein POJ06DRAFT_200648 [Lipomyces tetrasporus]
MANRNELVARDESYGSSSEEEEDDRTVEVEAGYTEVDDDESSSSGEQANEVDEEVDEEDDDGEEEEDEDDDDDDDEDEPRLKYTRIVDLPPTLFSSDPLSAFLAHEQFLVFATHGGTLHITTPDLKPIRTYRAHSASILSLSTDGTVIASASLDGRVVIASVTDAKDISASDFLRPVHAVSLDPGFQATRTFVSGGTACSLIMSEKGWLGRQSDTSLFHGEGPIDATDWTGDIILAMNDSGIHLYHAPTRSRISRIALPKDAPRADLYRPRISWISPSRFLVGWAYSIWIIKVIKTGETKDSKDNNSLLPIVSERKSEVETILSIDGLVSGVLRYDDESLLILTYNPPPSPTEDTPRPLALTPEIRLVSPTSGEEFSADQLSLRGYERLGANDYHLGVWNGTKSLDRKFYVLSARDGVIATERDENDKFDWLIEKKKYEEAWEMSQTLVDDARRRDIGIRWVESLIDAENWREAGAVLKRVLGATPVPPASDTDEEESDLEKSLREEWERWAWVFVTGGRVADIASYLPVSSPELSSVIYEMVLGYYLTNDKEQLYKFLDKWPIEIFDAKSIIVLMENKLKEEDDRKLRQNIAKLYVSIGNPNAAILHLLHIQDPAAIELIRDQHLLLSMLPSIPEILTINLTFEELESAPVSIIREKSAEAVDLVVEGRLELLPEKVVEQVMKSGMEVMAFLYLERLKEIDGFAAQGFADLQVNLYAEYDRSKLLDFLKKSNSYNLEKASEICERREYIPELVYILGKTGENKKALMLTINKLQDVDQAITFAKSQDDKDLWTDLLDYSMDKPKFIRALLEQAGTAIDPITLVRRISEGMQIEGLKPALQRILHEYELTLSIAHGAAMILNGEVEGYSEKLRRGRARGVKFEIEGLEQFKLSDTLIQFSCGHVFSERGLLSKSSSASDDEDVWLGGGMPTAIKSVAQKVTHLAFIREKLRSKECPTCVEERAKSRL